MDVILLSHRITAQIKLLSMLNDEFYEVSPVLGFDEYFFFHPRIKITGFKYPSIKKNRNI